MVGSSRAAASWGEGPASVSLGLDRGVIHRAEFGGRRASNLALMKWGCLLQRLKVLGENKRRGLLENSEKIVKM